MQTLKQTIETGWPETRQGCDNSIIEFFNYRDELSTGDGLIFRGQTILIPKQSRAELLEKVHVGHMGVDKTVSRAKDAFFWPGMVKEIKDYVLHCPISMKHRASNVKEPMVSHETPTRPWQYVHSDIFHLDGKDYLLITDSYSRHFEIDWLPTATSQTVILKLRGHFNRFGVPDMFYSDNGSQYTSQEFHDFAKK